MQVPIVDAAELLGVSPDTVRRRLQAGELTGEKRRGRYGDQWFVNVPDSYAQEAEQEATTEREQALDSLRDRIGYLESRLEGLLEENRELREDRNAWREQVQHGDEERRELRLLIAQALESRPALPAASGETSSSWWQRVRG